MLIARVVGNVATQKNGRSARLVLGRGVAAVDAAVIGVIDSVELQG